MKNHNSIEELNRLLKVRLEEWSHQRHQEVRPKPLITITQEPGCGAEKIAERLSSELGLHLYDWELVEQIAKDEHVSAQLVSALEKNPPNGFADFLAELNPEYGLASDRYVASLKRILLAIAVTGNAVIMERGSNFFFPVEEKIGLCFVAPLQSRVAHVMKELGLKEKEARAHISKLETGYRKLVKKYLQADMSDPTQYHLVINTGLVKLDTIVQLVKTMIQTVQDEKGEKL